MFILIFFFIFLVPCLVLIITLFAINYFYNVDYISKYFIYECGFDIRCNILVSNYNYNFILITLLFLIIDFELLLSFFWLISFSYLSFLGFYVFIFLTLLLDIGYFYLFFIFKFL